MSRYGAAIGRMKPSRRPISYAHSSRVTRALAVGVAIGLVAGMGAIFFSAAIEFSTSVLLEGIAGYTPPGPAGEGGAIESGPDRLWLIPVVVTLGGLLSGVIVYKFAPEAAGHGTDAAIASFHHRAGRTRLRAIPVKIVASAITIGSGGSAGREGPTAQIGAGFGSFLATRLKFSAADRRRALATGMGAGIGAIFRAPLGGAMMAAEVLYRDDLEADVILQALIASIVSYSVFGLWAGWDPIFGGTASFSFSEPGQLPFYIVLGVLCGIGGLAYAWAFAAAERAFKRLRLPRMAKPMFGAAIVGLIGLSMPESLHVGYGFVQQGMTPEGIAAFPMWLILLLPLAKIVTTSLTVGSGGSGGIFGPGMVIGGFVGAALWKLTEALPGVPDQPGPVVIISMISLFGSIAHVPLAMLLMVGEMTNNLSLLAPAMVAVATATLVVGDRTIYENQLPTRADSPAHRHRFSFPLLHSLPVDEVIRPVTVLPAATTPTVALEALDRTGAKLALIAGEPGQAPSGVTRESLISAPVGVIAIAELAAEPLPVIVSSASLAMALDRLADADRSWLPVIDGDGNAIGTVSTKDIMRSYRHAMEREVRALAPVGPDLETLEIPVGPSSSVAGHRLSEVDLPAGVRALTLQRNGSAFAPTGDTVLAPGDRIVFSVPASARARILRALIGGP